MELLEITENILAQFDEFWLISGDSQSGGVFNQDEINKILHFRESGKGLYIMGDDTDGSHDYSDDANPNR